MYKIVTLFVAIIIAIVSEIKTEGLKKQPPIVQTENGIIRGTYFTTYNKRIISAFLGVPFATPPTKTLRFHHPLPPKSWSGVVHANEMKDPCLQYNHVLQVNNENPITGSEDCLYLNVYTPKNFEDSSDKLMQVIVFIHGGAFMFGSSSRFNPSYLLDNNNFVFVTITYRVGPLGFLSTEDGIVPGNNGLKDQVMALKWVNRNIKSFGGDPSDVTIAGLSAGGVSVHLHYFSPMSVNLFKRGISLSGSALCPWAQMSEPKWKTIELAASLNCPTTDTRVLINCLRDRPANLILSKTKELFFGWLYNPISPFGPTIEVSNEQQFLGEHPITLLRDGKIQDLPWLVGFTTEEGLYPASEFILNTTLVTELKEKWFEKTPYILNYNYIFEKQKTELSEKIKNFYLNETSEKNTENIHYIIEMIGDRLYVNPIDKAIKMQSLVNRSPIYVYNFAYRGKYSSSDLFTGVTTNIGVSHGDDAAYVLNCYFSCTDETNDKSMVRTMVKVWSDYIKNGTPLFDTNIKWYPVNRNHQNNFINFLYINSSDNLFMSKSNNLGNNLFWNTLQFSDNVIMHDEF